MSTPPAEKFDDAWWLGCQPALRPANIWAVRPSVLIVDDHRRFRASARTLLESEGFDVVGEAADGDGALREVASLRARARLGASTTPLPRDHETSRLPMPAAAISNAISTTVLSRACSVSPTTYRWPGRRP
jgi:hypothetical protein